MHEAFDHNFMNILRNSCDRGRCVFSLDLNSQMNQKHDLQILCGIRAQLMLRVM